MKSYLGKNADGLLEREDRVYFDRDMKRKIIKKSDERCAHCGKPISVKTMTVEHVIPISKGGTNELENLVALCECCNKEKSNKVVNASYYPWLRVEHSDSIHSEISRYTDNPYNVTAKNLINMDVFSMEESWVDEFQEMSIRMYKGMNSVLRDKYKTRPDEARMKQEWNKMVNKSSRLKGMTVSRVGASDFDEVLKFYKRYLKETVGYSEAKKLPINDMLNTAVYENSLYAFRDGMGDIIGAFSFRIDDCMFYDGKELILDMLCFRYVNDIIPLIFVVQSLFMDKIVSLSGLKEFPVSFRTWKQMNNATSRFFRAIKSSYEVIIDGVFIKDFICNGFNVELLKNETMEKWLESPFVKGFDGEFFEEDSEYQKWLNAI